MIKPPLYFYNAHLIDGSGRGTGDEPYALLVDGRHIRALAPLAHFPQPDGATTGGFAGYVSDARHD